MANIIGRITVNSKVIYEVDDVPSSGAGTPAPRGSMAMYDSGVVGSVYIKTGAADTAWQSVDVPEGADWELDGNTLTDAGGGPTDPNEFFGSLNNFDVIFQRNSTELMRLVADGLLVGLSATLGGRLQAGVAALGDEIFKQSSPNGGAGQRVIHVTRQYKVQTTDDTPTVLASLAIPITSRVQATFRIGANQHGGVGGTVGDGADYISTISAKRLAAGNAILNDIQTDFTEEDAGFFNRSFDVNTNNIDLTIEGGVDRDMAWSAHAEIMIFTD